MEGSRELMGTLRVLESQDRFSEAEAMLREVRTLREQQERELLVRERMQQANEEATVDSAHLYVYDQLQTAWARDIRAFDAETQQLAEYMQAKHEEERRDLEAELAAPKRLKLSPKLLNLLERKQQAIKQRRYRDAQSLTIEIESLLPVFDQSQRVKLDSKAQLRLNSLFQAHMKEEKAFQQKRAAQRAELELRRQDALTHLRKQYDKNKRELVDLHRLQNSRRGGTAPASIARVLTVSRSCLTSPR